jgi:hypothetical protein
MLQLVILFPKQPVTIHTIGGGGGGGGKTGTFNQFQLSTGCTIIGPIV